MGLAAVFGSLKCMLCHIYQLFWSKSLVTWKFTLRIISFNASQRREGERIYLTHMRFLTYKAHYLLWPNEKFVPILSWPALCVVMCMLIKLIIIHFAALDGDLKCITLLSALPYILWQNKNVSGLLLTFFPREKKIDFAYARILMTFLRLSILELPLLDYLRQVLCLNGKTCI